MAQTTTFELRCTDTGLIEISVRPIGEDLQSVTLTPAEARYLGHVITVMASRDWDETEE